MAAASSGAAKLTKEFMQDLRADIRHLRSAGDAVVQLLAELEAYGAAGAACTAGAEGDTKMPGTPPSWKYVAQALQAIEACTARSQLCTRDVAEALAELRRAEGTERPPGWAADCQAVLALRQWVQCPGVTAHVKMRSLRYCRQIFETEDYWSGSMQARQERCAREDPQSQNWVLDVVPYDGGYWALNGPRLCALLGAAKARAKRRYSGLARVRFWPLNNIVRIRYKKGEKDGVLAVFFRLLSKEMSLQEQMLETAKSDSETDTSSSESRSRSRSPAGKRPIAPTSNMSSWSVAKRATVTAAKLETPIKAQKVDHASSGGKALVEREETSEKLASSDKTTRDDTPHVRSAYVRKTDILRHGPTEKCPGCRAIMGDLAGPQSHSQPCRERIIAAKEMEEIMPERNTPTKTDKCSMVVSTPAAFSAASTSKASEHVCTALQETIVAAEAVLQYTSNRDGAPGFYLLHHDLESSAASLPDEKLRSAVQELVQEMRKMFKSNTASTYRVPARQILAILEEGKTGNYDPSSRSSQVKVEAALKTDAASSSAPATERKLWLKLEPKPDTDAEAPLTKSPGAIPSSVLAAKATAAKCTKEEAMAAGAGKAAKCTKEEATAAGAGKEKSLSEEVQRVLAACDDLATVDSNMRGGGGGACYQAARPPLEEAAQALEEPLRAIVQERLDFMRKTYKANTPGSYRSVCKDIREFLVKDVV